MNYSFVLRARKKSPFFSILDAAYAREVVMDGAHDGHFIDIAEVETAVVFCDIKEGLRLVELEARHEDTVQRIEHL